MLTACKGHDDIARLLIEANADVNQQTKVIVFIVIIRKKIMYDQLNELVMAYLLEQLDRVSAEYLV